MRIRYFAHSWLSDWNHGNAHFLRGLASALVRRGHEVRLYEPMPGPSGGWSLAQLLEEPKGAQAVQQVRQTFPELNVRLFRPWWVAGGEWWAAPGAGGAGRLCQWELPWVCDWREELHEAEVVIVHEWNEPELFNWLLGERRRYGFRMLLHDTHHRAWSEPARLDRLPLGELDGVIAFGESVRQLYEKDGRARRSYTLQEAADVDHFQPRGEAAEDDVVWIGNWGDEERTRELDAFLFQPVREAQAKAKVYGVRYPVEAQARLRAAGISYGGYLANLDAPAAYARARVTMHIPRGPYAGALPGIPTIRVYEALACGMALLSAPWTDSERIFTAGEDYWPVRNGTEAAAMLVQLLSQPKQRKELGRHGAAAIAARHTCGHRAQELEAICHDLS